MINETIKIQHLDRRELLGIVGASAMVAMGLGVISPAKASAGKAAEAIKKVTGGKSPSTGEISIEAPQIAENGSTVPIKVKIDAPVSGNDGVKKVHVFADGNPNPDVASFQFSDLSGKAQVATRIRLIKSQNVVVLAELNNGSFMMGKSQIKVTIGGCGG